MTMQELIDDMVTINDLMIIFNVRGLPTIHRWRKTRELERAVIKIPSDGRPAIRFSLKEVIKWAKETNTPTPKLREWRRARADRE